VTVQQVYREGDAGVAVGEIRSMLARVGLLPSAPLPTQWSEARFDAETAAAVREFQQQRGLIVDGLVGPESWRHLEEARWQLGDRVLAFAVSHPLTGDDVLDLQNRLMSLGFDPGSLDGAYGTRTELAVRAFQRESGLAADGVCGPQTFAAFSRLSRSVTGGSSQALRESAAIRSSGPSLARKVIVIDPGHGGKDRGNVADGLAEADLVEDIAARLEGRINAAGAIAYLSRGRLEPDQDPPGSTDRVGFANTAGADLFISLHVDSDRSRAAAGVATYYYANRRTGTESPTGRQLADLIQREVCARTDLLNCRNHGKTWDLLRGTQMPAVRVEIGYLTNAHDASRLADPAFRDTVAEAILAAIQRLYLPPEADHPTGAIDLAAIRALLGA
jgi:N-acetylmuramoyl-L-alanine amidase